MGLKAVFSARLFGIASSNAFAYLFVSIIIILIICSKPKCN